MRQQRSKAGGKTVKALRGKAALRGRNAPKPTRHRKSSTTAQGREIVRLTRELQEARKQQTATSEVRPVINSTPGDLAPVFDDMTQKALELCGAAFGGFWLIEGGIARAVATHNVPAPFDEFLRHEATPVEQIVGRNFADRPFVQAPDLRETASYRDNTPLTVAAVDLAGIRTFIAVPLRREGLLVGIFAIYRQEVRPFSEQEIALVQNFAGQAVIAIENARLLNELRHRTADLSQRTTDLTEALEQQTATSEVLQVISSSFGDFERVLATILDKAVRICGAKIGNVYLWDGEALRVAASNNTPSDYAAVIRMAFRPNVDKSAVGRMIANKAVVQIADMRVGENYLARDPRAVAAVELGGVRTLLAVPMLKENDLVGAFVLSRQEVRPFTEKQVELIKNFAAQAVIAIENARLLKELRERTEQVEAQSQELRALNQQLEQRVADQVGEIERMSRLRRFLPPQVADLIVASGTEKQLESHRREITALFCDLRGFTGFSESADPEDVMALLRDYHAAIGEIVIKYSGTLERYAGDGVMVVFNDPVPVEKPPLQAVLMALEMRDVIGALTDKWRRLGHDIGFGIGIAHGFATLGTIGFEGRFDYAAIGTVSNVASRLCDEAKPGQILISPRVFMAVEDAVSVEPVGEFTLKGIRRPLAAYNVLAAVSSKP